MLDSNGSFDNPFFQDKKIVKIDCKWKGQEYSKDTFGFTHAEYVCSFILKENPEAEIVLVPIVRKNKKSTVLDMIEGEYCFWGLRVGPVVRTPSTSEMKQILLKNPKTAQAVKEHRVTAAMIRAVTYDLLREELGRCCGISKEEAGLAIGNQLDCAPHEDGSGYIFMVPNWAHKWFRHDGYVSKMLSEMNQ